MLLFYWFYLPTSPKPPCATPSSFWRFELTDRYLIGITSKLYVGTTLLQKLKEEYPDSEPSPTQDSPAVYMNAFQYHYRPPHTISDLYNKWDIIEYQPKASQMFTPRSEHRLARSFPTLWLSIPLHFCPLVTNISRPIIWSRMSRDAQSLHSDAHPMQSSSLSVRSFFISTFKISLYHSTLVSSEIFRRRSSSAPLFATNILPL